MENLTLQGGALGIPSGSTVLLHSDPFTPALPWTDGRRMRAFWTPRESNKHFVRWREGKREGATAGVNPGGLAPLWGVDGGEAEEMRVVSGAISRPVLFFYRTHELVFSPQWPLSAVEIRELSRPRL